jgi:hypothetical protein
MNGVINKLNSRNVSMNRIYKTIEVSICELTIWINHLVSAKVGVFA